MDKETKVIEAENLKKFAFFGSFWFYTFDLWNSLGVAVSTIATLTAIVAVPMLCIHMQTVHAGLQEEINFCRLRNAESRGEYVKVFDHFSSNKRIRFSWNPFDRNVANVRQAINVVHVELEVLDQLECLDKKENLERMELPEVLEPLDQTLRMKTLHQQPKISALIVLLHLLDHQDLLDLRDTLEAREHPESKDHLDVLDQRDPQVLPDLLVALERMDLLDNPDSLDKCVLLLLPLESLELLERLDLKDLPEMLDDLDTMDVPDLLDPLETKERMDNQEKMEKMELLESPEKMEAKDLATIVLLLVLPLDIRSFLNNKTSAFICTF